MDKEIIAAINENSRRILEIQKQMDNFTQMLHLQNADEIKLNGGGVIEIANIVSKHDISIGDILTRLKKLEVK